MQRSPSLAREDLIEWKGRARILIIKQMQCSPCSQEAGGLVVHSLHPAEFSGISSHVTCNQWACIVKSDILAIFSMTG